MKRVAITGVGAASVLGLTAHEIAQSLYTGRAGIVFESERLEHGLRSGLTGRIEGFDAGKYLNRKQRKSMPDFAIHAHSAAMDAILHAGLTPQDMANEHTGLIFGNDSCVIPALEQAQALEQSGNTESMGSGHVFRCMNSTITMNLNVLFGNTGAGWTVSAACASGAYALGMAADAIRLGRMERVLCGAAQELGWKGVSAFDGLGAFSTRHDTPQSASRPFDVSRDGLVPSGGAAAVMLEEYELAHKRGAKILGEICGFGCSADGEGLVLPSTVGLSRAMHMALRDARLTPQDITLINAHATATPRGDAAEAANIHRVFEDTCPPIMALKALTGHELWMSGAAQVVYATLMAERGFTAPTYNFTQADDSTAGASLTILTQRLEEPPKRMLCNSAGFGGSNACLVVHYS